MVRHRIFSTALPQIGGRQIWELGLPGVGRAERRPEAEDVQGHAAPAAAGSTKSSPAAAHHSAAATGYHTGPTAGHQAARTAQCTSLNQA